MQNDWMNPLNSETTRLIGTLDRWLQRFTLQTTVGQESDCLVWDGWVHPDEAAQ